MREGPCPDFHDAFTQLHLGQLLAFTKCISRNRRDGGIDPNMDYIMWDSSSSFSGPHVDKDVVIISIASHNTKYDRTSEPDVPSSNVALCLDCFTNNLSAQPQDSNQPLRTNEVPAISRANVSTRQPTSAVGNGGRRPLLVWIFVE